MAPKKASKKKRQRLAAQRTARESLPLLSVYSAALAPLLSVASPMRVHDAVLRVLDWNTRCAQFVVQFAFECGDILFQTEQLTASAYGHEHGPAATAAAASASAPASTPAAGPSSAVAASAPSSLAPVPLGLATVGLDSSGSRISASRLSSLGPVSIIVPTASPNRALAALPVPPTVAASASASLSPLPPRAAGGAAGAAAAVGGQALASEWSVSLLRARAHLFERRGEWFWSASDHACYATQLEAHIDAGVELQPPSALLRSLSGAHRLVPAPALPLSERAADGWLSAAKRFERCGAVDLTLQCLDRAKRLLLPRLPATLATTAAAVPASPRTLAAALTAAARGDTKSPTMAPASPQLRGSPGSPALSPATPSTGASATPVIHRAPSVDPPSAVDWFNTVLAPYGLRVVCDDPEGGGGRSLRTLVARKAGEILFREEPVVSWHQAVHDATHCDHCSKRLAVATALRCTFAATTPVASAAAATTAATTTSDVTCPAQYCSAQCRTDAERYHPFLCAGRCGGRPAPTTFLDPSDPDYAIVNPQLISVARVLALLRCHPCQPHQAWPLVYGLHLLMGDTHKRPLSHLAALNRTPAQYKRMTHFYDAFCRALGLRPAADDTPPSEPGVTTGTAASSSGGTAVRPLALAAVDDRTCSRQLFDHLFAVVDVNEWSLASSAPADALLRGEPDAAVAADDSDDASDGEDQSPSASAGAAGAAAFVAAPTPDAGVPVGGARMGLFSSLFNHSCSPNVTMLDAVGQTAAPAVSTAGHALVPRVTCDVAAGAELCVSYVDPSEDDVNVRARKLASYGFRCGCARCRPFTAPAVAAKALESDVLALFERTGI